MDLGLKLLETVTGPFSGFFIVEGFVPAFKIVRYFVYYKNIDLYPEYEGVRVCGN